MSRTKIAIIGSGSLGTDLAVGVVRAAEPLETRAIVGIVFDAARESRSA